MGRRAVSRANGDRGRGMRLTLAVQRRIRLTLLATAKRSHSGPYGTSMGLITRMGRKIQVWTVCYAVSYTEKEENSGRFRVFVGKNRHGACVKQKTRGTS